MLGSRNGAGWLTHRPTLRRRTQRTNQPTGLTRGELTEALARRRAGVTSEPAQPRVRQLRPARRPRRHIAAPRPLARTGAGRSTTDAAGRSPPVCHSASRPGSLGQPGARCTHRAPPSAHRVPRSASRLLGAHDSISSRVRSRRSWTHFPCRVDQGVSGVCACRITSPGRGRAAAGFAGRSLSTLASLAPLQSSSGARAAEWGGQRATDMRNTTVGRPRRTHCSPTWVCCFLAAIRLLLSGRRVNRQRRERSGDLPQPAVPSLRRMQA